MEVDISLYNDYAIFTEEGEKKGIFFRSPIQKIDFVAYSDNAVYSAWTYLYNLKNPVRKFFEILKGNSYIIKHIEEWSNELNWGGFEANILCFPIYFKRTYRKLHAIGSNPNNDIQEITSYGYESQYEVCAGDCVKETTYVKLKGGKTKKVVTKEKYHFTYKHIIEKILGVRQF